MRNLISSHFGIMTQRILQDGMLVTYTFRRKHRLITYTYLLFHLLILPCFAFKMDTLYFSSLSDETLFRKFCPLSLSRCIYGCKIRSRCEAITYSKMLKSCSLLSHVSLPSEEAHAGIVGVNKAEWDMVINI